MSLVPSTASVPAGPSGGNISDVVGLILDKGLVIDVYMRVSLVGIEILTVDARVVVASVDTYLRFAEAAGRLDIEASRRPGLPDLLQGLTGARSKAPVALDRGEEPVQMPVAPVGQGAAVPTDGKDDRAGPARQPRKENGQ